MTKQEFLAISLPYGLKCKTLDIEVEDFDTMFYFQEFEANEKSIYNETYPYLHPLSDLTKPIEHNGEKFVPIVELAKISYPERYVSLYVYRDGIIRAEIDFEDYYVHLYFDGKDFVSDSSIQNQFKLFQKLIEWHFDIAGLIEKGEAIDVNTLPENPYK